MTKKTLLLFLLLLGLSPLKNHCMDGGSGEKALIALGVIGAYYAAKKTYKYFEVQSAKQRLSKQPRALYRACMLGNMEEVLLLIEAGADVNAMWESGTALHWAVHFKKLEIVKLLIASGADVNAENGRHETPLLKCARVGSVEIAKILIDHGASLDALSLPDKHTPLYLAVLHGFSDLAKLLIERGADPNIPNAQFRTPLHAACMKNEIDLTQTLIQGRAAINALDYEGNTPLHLACGFGNAKIAELLIKNQADIQADINARNLNFRTPLMTAIQNNHLEPVQILIDAGAEVDVKDLGNNTLLHCAASQETADIAQLLLSQTRLLLKPEILPATTFNNIRNEQEVFVLKNLALWNVVKNIDDFDEDALDTTIDNIIYLLQAQPEVYFPLIDLRGKIFRKALHQRIPKIYEAECLRRMKAALLRQNNDLQSPLDIAGSPEVKELFQSIVKTQYFYDLPVEVREIIKMI